MFQAVTARRSLTSSLRLLRTVQQLEVHTELFTDPLCVQVRAVVHGHGAEGL